MKKYLLATFYLVVMYAIYRHPIVLPNEGKSIPTWEEEKQLPMASDQKYASEILTQKSPLFGKMK